MVHAGPDSLTIGQVAKAAGVGVETIRFYEREGLINEPARRPSGYRQYPQDAVRRIQFIKNAKALGFSLKEISELLELKLDPEEGCADVGERALSKITDIEEKIHSLKRMKAALHRMVERCESKGDTSGCLILEELDRGPVDPIGGG